MAARGTAAYRRHEPARIMTFPVPIIYFVALVYTVSYLYLKCPFMLREMPP
jgi:hypothetical protein